MKSSSPFLDALRAGAALAGLFVGCGGQDDPPKLPAERVLECSGPVYPQGSGGYLGQCCEHIVCREPKDGVCPPNDDGQFYGSGICRCGKNIEGPYAYDPSDPRFAKASSKGACCYVTASIVCTGRPLRIDDQARVAAVVLRSDWV